MMTEVERIADQLPHVSAANFEISFGETCALP
jgi:hypothetical protein